MWPENWQPLCIFLRLQTQWQMGTLGPVGLRYETLAFWLDLEQVQRQEWPQVVNAVQVLEQETLRLFRQQGEQGDTGD